MPLKTGGRTEVETGVNQKLDYVANEIVRLIKENDLYAATTYGGRITFDLLLCDEDKREAISLGLNDDDRLVIKSRNEI